MYIYIIYTYIYIHVYIYYIYMYIYVYIIYITYIYVIYTYIYICISYNRPVRVARDLYGRVQNGSLLCGTSESCLIIIPYIPVLCHNFL